MKYLLVIGVCLVMISCSSETVPQLTVKDDCCDDSAYIEHTSYSESKIDSSKFCSALAINRIADIENEYFNQYESGYSKYYGTQWKYDYNYDRYMSTMDSLDIPTDSMHCTIYAMEALKAGFGNQFDSLNQFHKQIWKDREYAGWSIGYLLVTKFNWKAYLVIDSNSVEYERCLKSYNKDKTYPVWHQPKIPLEDFIVFGKNDSLIHKHLKQTEFGWGFSYQGYHTWITRFDDLLECNWSGCPSVKFQEGGTGDLFKKTTFKDYADYDSHVIIFPPK